MAVRAGLWDLDPAGQGGVVCRLCSHYCRIPDAATGRCRVRGNRGGVLYSSSSETIAAANLDPVEKKPLFHFLPGTMTFSLGTPGCNMACAFCQNHALSQAPAFTPGTLADTFPAPFGERIMASVLETGAASLSFTYNEPTRPLYLSSACFCLKKTILT